MSIELRKRHYIHRVCPNYWLVVYVCCPFLYFWQFLRRFTNAICRHHTVGCNGTHSHRKRRKEESNLMYLPVPAAAGVATQDDLQTGAAHGAVRLVAVFIIAVQGLGEVLLQTAKWAWSTRFVGATRLCWRNNVARNNVFSWRLDTDKLGCCNEGKWSRKCRKTPVRLMRYLAFQTKTAFKQRVLNSNLGWATWQAKIWKSKWSTPRS